MRIVQVVHGLPPQDMAGTELLTLELSRALQARGHQVTVIARTSAPEAAEFSVQYEQDIAPDTGQDIEPGIGQDTGQNTGQDTGHARDTSDRGVRIIRIVNNHTLTQSFQSQYDNAFFDHTFRQRLAGLPGRYCPFSACRPPLSRFDSPRLRPWLSDHIEPA